MFTHTSATPKRRGGARNLLLTSSSAVLPKAVDPIIVDPYQVLQVRRDATHSEIRQSYRRLALLHHPGRTAYKTNACRYHARQQRLAYFQVLAACLETLLDRGARRRCDLLLRDLEVMQKTNLQSWPYHVLGQVRVGGNVLGGEHDRMSLSSSSSSVGSFGNVPALSLVSSSCSTDGDEEEEEESKTSSIGDDVNSAVDEECSLPSRQDDNEKAYARCNSFRRRHRLQKRSAQKKGSSPTLSILTCCHAPSDQVDNDYYFSPSNSMDMEDMPQPMGNGGLFRRRRQAKSIMNINTKSNSSEESSTPDIHYTQVETNRLFGGPLQLLYRARRWKPFTDPFAVFAKVFGSTIPFVAACADDSNYQNDNSLTTRDGCDHCTCSSNSTKSNAGLFMAAPRHVTAMAGTWEVLPNGTKRFCKTRVLPDRIITRTELIRTDPETGQLYSTVKVTSQPTTLSAAEDSDEIQFMPCWMKLDEHCQNTSSWLHCPIGRAEQQRGSNTDSPKHELNLSHHLEQEFQRRCSQSESREQEDEGWGFTRTCQSWLPVCI